MRETGKLLVIVGVIIAVAGMLLMFSDRIPLLGKLPGDITIKRGSIHIFLPITTSIVLSLLFSLILWAISQWRGR